MDSGNIFKPPIFYNKDKVKLKQHIIDDLELVKTVDEQTKPITDYLFRIRQKLSKKKWGK